MYLFFDTETTGLPLAWNAPVGDLDNWPRMVQIAWLLYDNKANKIKERNYIIKPEGFEIPAEASDVHGITTAIAYEKGKNLYDVLKEFYEDLQETTCLVAHNISFDEMIVGAEFIRMNLETSQLLGCKRVCTMKASTNYCKIKKYRGYGYKWPRLDELHYHLFNEYFTGAHDALPDVEACARCFFELKKRDII